MSFTAIRDPRILAEIDAWAELMCTMITQRVSQTLGLADDEYAFDLRPYGHNAVLGDLEPESGPPREVGVMLLVNAPDQATATAVAKVANPLMLHLPTPAMDYLPSLASSPAEVERRGVRVRAEPRRRLRRPDQPVPHRDGENVNA
ncbi:hypothetical protein [Amycolatopsis aidingensis]|uniref:hypothetical protein n=1 Tax=Amycolatopsis aidingensis TaxID=2842453 RepID=UPI001E3739D9|nr:hypothetical protein [Amycolatopsis aidingensis]